MIKLTDIYDRPIYFSLDCVACMFRVDSMFRIDEHDYTRLERANGEFYNVKETPEQIISAWEGHQEAVFAEQYTRRKAIDAAWEVR